jgi:hypothetical protein
MRSATIVHAYLQAAGVARRPMRRAMSAAVIAVFCRALQGNVNVSRRGMPTLLRRAASRPPL